MINGILDSLDSQTNPLTINDFVALHQNGQTLKPGAYGILRPPTITAKFIRYNYKEQLFSKQAVIARKRLGILYGYGLHQKMCPSLIVEQKLIARYPYTKIVNFQRGNRGFSVCLKSEKFINYIKSFNHFKPELQTQNVKNDE